MSLTALYDEHRQLRGFGKVIRDVTEQRAVERQLRSSAGQMRSILSTVPDAMVVIDARGRSSRSAPPPSGCSAMPRRRCWAATSAG
jgi:PAS domain-containing protein